MRYKQLAAFVVLGCAAAGCSKSDKSEAPDMRGPANRDAARAQASMIRVACDVFKRDMDKYPQSLDQLVDGSKLGPQWKGPYIERIPKDPWGHEYVYRYKPGDGKLKIYSVGFDGKPGTPDDVDEETFD